MLSVAAKVVRRVPRYDLSDEESIELTRQLIRSRPLGDKPYGIYVLDGRDPFADLARTVEGGVFWQKFGDFPEDRQQQCAPYEERSTFILAVFQREWEKGPHPVGVIRIISGKALSDFRSINKMGETWGMQTIRAAQARLDCVQTWDVASMAIHPDVRSQFWGSRVVLAILYSLYRMIRDHEVEWLVGILADDVLRDLSEVGFTFQPIAESKEYDGWPSTPFVLNVSKLPEEMKAKPVYAELLSTGANSRGKLSRAFDFAEEIRPQT
jgi:hypothetical protein